MNQTTSQTQTAGAALVVRGLRSGYADAPDVLCGIDLQVQPGERVGIIGANGSGKTTLFLTLCGVLTPLAGEIVLAGVPVVPGAFRPEIGMVFQNPDDQLFCPSVRDDVAFGPINLGLPPAEVAARVDAALSATGTTHLIERPPHHLSGGEKRMVAIAGVLALHPRLVIYDEPDAYLDTHARRRLVQFLQASPETALIASHSLDFLLAVCSRLVLLEAGQICADGTPDELGIADS